MKNQEITIRVRVFFWIEFERFDKYNNDWCDDFLLIRRFQKLKTKNTMFFHYDQSNRFRVQDIANEFWIVENRRHDQKRFETRTSKIDCWTHNEENVEIFQTFVKNIRFSENNQIVIASILRSQNWISKR